jgi:non-homologous end joining protein Ku
VTIWATRTVNNLWVIEAVDDRLVAVAHCWPETVRAVPAVANVDLLDAEEAMFTTLAETLYSDFDPAEYVNASRLGLQELIASRTGTELMTVPGVPAVSAGTDMMAMLQAAVEAAGGPVGVPEKPAPKKRTTTKKAPSVPKQRTA